MACCILTAVIMNQLIKACDALDIRFFQIKYNDAGGDACAPADSPDGSSTETRRITIKGMTCGACTSSISETLQDVDGVFRSSVSLALGHATVSYDSYVTTPEIIVSSIQAVGYDASLGERSSQEIIEELRQPSELRDLKTAIFSTGMCLSIIVSLEYLRDMAVTDPAALQFLTWIVLLLTFRVQIWDARMIHIRAWKGKARKAATMDTLLSLSLLLGLFKVAIQVTFGNLQRAAASMSSGPFLTVTTLAGKYLQAVLKRESSANLAALYELQAEGQMYRLYGNGVRLHILSIWAILISL